jgi:hypothetical protein
MGIISEEYEARILIIIKCEYGMPGHAYYK